jgi:hypothetical protein
MNDQEWESHAAHNRPQPSQLWNPEAPARPGGVIATRSPVLAEQAIRGKSTPSEGWLLPALLIRNEMEPFMFQARFDDVDSSVVGIC